MAQANTARTLDTPLDDDPTEAPFTEPPSTARTDTPAASTASTASSLPRRDADAETDTESSPSGAGITAETLSRRAASVGDLALLGDIPVDLSMEIGRTRITIEELMNLGRGSVVELQRMADEPLDVLVNGTLVAHGEAVVVGERFGIRLTEVVSRAERLEGLG